MMRIGNGFDVHAFGEGDHLMLGGVRVPFERGVVAHSDGDVAIHALCDAILGALALGDIGTHFPPSEMRTNLRFIDRAIDWPSEVLPTPGGPTKQRIGPFMHAAIAGPIAVTAFSLLMIKRVGIEERALEGARR